MKGGKIKGTLDEAFKMSLLDGWMKSGKIRLFQFAFMKIQNVKNISETSSLKC